MTKKSIPQQQSGSGQSGSDYASPRTQVDGIPGMTNELALGGGKGGTAVQETNPARLTEIAPNAITDENSGNMDVQQLAARGAIKSGNSSGMASDYKLRHEEDSNA